MSSPDVVGFPYEDSVMMGVPPAVPAAVPIPPMYMSGPGMPGISGVHDFKQEEMPYQMNSGLHSMDGMHVIGGVPQAAPIPADFSVSQNSLQAEHGKHSYKQKPTPGAGGGGPSLEERCGGDRKQILREKNRRAAAASRLRKKEYIQNLEKTNSMLQTEKLELQLKVATLTNQTWEQKLKIEELEKQLQELRAVMGDTGLVETSNLHVDQQHLQSQLHDQQMHYSHEDQHYSQHNGHGLE